MKDKIYRAMSFSMKAHQNQKRKYSGKDYFSHPFKVFELLKDVTKDTDILCAGLLHDVVEDTKYIYDDIKSEFNEKIADLVMEVTKNKDGNFNIKSKGGMMIKCADMLHNLSDSEDANYVLKKIKFMRGFI